MCGVYTLAQQKYTNQHMPCGAYIVNTQIYMLYTQKPHIEQGAIWQTWAQFQAQGQVAIFIFKTKTKYFAA